MILQIVFFILASAIVVAGAWQLAGISGHVVASIGPFTVETSTSFAILLLVALLIAFFMFLRVIQGILRIPYAGGNWRRRHRLALGERAVTRVLVALAAGEQSAARKEARRARNLLGDTPQTLLLVAEAGRLSGRVDESEEAFRALTKQKNARFLGLSGLLRQAVDRREWPEALVIAKEAEAAHPGTIWLRHQRVELALQTENWAEALELIGPNPRRTTYYVAAADAETDPSRAFSFAKLAWKQDPIFSPAILASRNRLRTTGHEKRAQSCIAKAWKHAPHPELATFALAPEPSNLERVQAAKRLIVGNPTHSESRLLLARVALDAGLTGEARHQVEIAESEGVRQRRLYMLLAEVEEQERGDTEFGRIAQRDALRKAAIAEADPHWCCTNCHTDYTVWRPKCESCDGVGTLQWLTAVRESGYLSSLANQHSKGSVSATTNTIVRD